MRKIYYMPAIDYIVHGTCPVQLKHDNVSQDCCVAQEKRNAHSLSDMARCPAGGLSAITCSVNVLRGARIIPWLAGEYRLHKGMQFSQAFLGRYQVIRPIGKGGMGEVYLAGDLFTKRQVALKQLKRHLISHSAVASMKYEFGIMNQLRDPYLVRVYDFFLTPFRLTPCISMEFIDGFVLDTVIPMLPLHDRLVILLKITRALAALHSLNILHLDIKAANVMVRRNNEPVLMDFSLSRQVHDIDPSQVMGTINYMAPEMLHHRVPLDTYTDIYSLGVLFYKVLTKHFPYHVSTPKELMSAFALLQRNGLYAMSAYDVNIPSGMQNLVAKMLKVSAAERPADATAIAGMLEQQIGDVARHVKVPVSYLFYSRFVDRRDSLRIIQQMVGRVRTASGDNPAVINVYGPQGIGKTRLAQQAKYMMQLAGIITIDSACFKLLEGSNSVIVDILEKVRALLASYGQEFPFAADEQVPDDPMETRTYSNGLVADSSPLSGAKAPEGAQIQRLLSRLDLLIGDYLRPEILGSSLKIMKTLSIKELYQKTFRLLSQISALFPFALLIENGDQDAGIRDFLKLYIPFYRYNRRSKRFFLLITSQTQLLPHADDLYWALPLENLDKAACRGLIESMLLTRLRPDMLDLFYTHSNGYPVHIQEWLRFLFYNGDVHWTGSQWLLHAKALAPQSLTGLLQRNLARLSPGSFHILAAIALAGMPLVFTVLTDVFPAMTPGELGETLAVLENEQWLESRFLLSGQKEYSLGHDSLSATVLRGLDQENQVSLLKRLTGAFFTYSAKNRVLPGILARIAYQAREYPLAYAYAKRAAGQLIENFSFSPGLKMLNIAMYALNRLGARYQARHKDRRLKLYLLHTKLANRNSRYKYVHAWLVKSAPMAKATTCLSLKMDHLMYRRDYYLYVGQLDKAKRIAKGTIQLSRDRDREFYVKALAGYARILYLMEQYKELQQVYRDLREPIYQLRNKDFIGLYHMNRGIFAKGGPRYQHAIADYKTALAIAKETGNIYLLASCYGNIAIYYWYFGSLEQVLEYHKLSMLHFKRMSYHFGLVNGYFLLSLFFFVKHDCKKSIASADKCIQLNAQQYIEDILFCDSLEMVFINLYARLDPRALTDKEKAYARDFSLHPYVGDFASVVAACARLRMQLFVFGRPEALDRSFRELEDGIASLRRKGLDAADGYAKVLSCLKRCAGYAHTGERAEGLKVQEFIVENFQRWPLMYSIHSHELLLLALYYRHMDLARDMVKNLFQTGHSNIMYGIFRALRPLYATLLPMRARNADARVAPRDLTDIPAAAGKLPLRYGLAVYRLVHTLVPDVAEDERARFSQWHDGLERSARKRLPEDEYTRVCLLHGLRPSRT